MNTTEIKQTRFGGLGGSDAALVARIACNGVENLSNTDLHRLAVMVGAEEYKPFEGNAATKAGHLFEEEFAEAFPTMERERLIMRESSDRFKTFAHADFFDIQKGQSLVVECKFSQKETAEVADTYKWQLQWYYFLGIDTVKLVHGWGDTEPFQVSGQITVDIERDEKAIATLEQGVKTLSDALSQGWRPQPKNEAEGGQRVFQLAENILIKQEQIKLLQADIDAMKQEITERMEIEGVAKYTTSHHTITMTSATTVQTFDAKRCVKEHPEMSEYYKQTTRKGSLTVKAKGE